MEFFIEKNTLHSCLDKELCGYLLNILGTCDVKGFWTWDPLDGIQSLSKALLYLSKRYFLSWAEVPSRSLGTIHINLMSISKLKAYKSSVHIIELNILL